MDFDALFEKIYINNVTHFFNGEPVFTEATTEAERAVYALKEALDKTRADLRAQTATAVALAAEVECLKASRAPKQGGEMREALERIIDHAEDWHAHYCEMWGERRKDQQDAILGDIMNARALLARESSEPILEEHDRWIDTDAIPPKPAEERGPEVGDMVAWIDRQSGDKTFAVYPCDCTGPSADNPNWKLVVLMRRAEVEAKIGGRA